MAFSFERTFYFVLGYSQLGDFPGGSDGKASVYNAGNPGSIPGLGRSPGEGNGNPYPVLLAGKSHGQRSLVGYSPWGRKESDTTERLHFHFQTDIQKGEMNAQGQGQDVP